MKILMRISSTIVIIISFIIIASCGKSDPVSPINPGINPFNNGGNERNMIVVISDIHLGADLAYAECSKNLASLEKLLTQIRMAPNVKELVIAGDLLDEWFVPATTDTYQGKDQSDFVQRIAIANKGVINALTG